MIDPEALAAVVRTHPGLAAKRPLTTVSEVLGGDGGDAAVLADGDGALVLAAEAIWTPFLVASPRAAGVAGVVTVLNDLAASGARPIALLDTLVAADEPAARELLIGLKAGADLYGVPVVGGHLTLDAASGPALSTFGVGRARRPLVASAARPGDAVCLAVCLEGVAVPQSGGGSFFSHLRGPRRERAAADLALLAEVAEAGEAWAARDVSMPGVAGSLLQFCEGAGGLGCALDLDRLPVPGGVDLAQWLVTFPSYGFILVGDPDALRRRFTGAGLTLAQIGVLDDTGRLRLVSSGGEALVWDLRKSPLTGLGSPA